MDCCIPVLGVFLKNMNMGIKYVPLKEIKSCLSKSNTEEFSYDNTPSDALKFLIFSKRVRKVSKDLFAFNGDILTLRNYLLSWEKKEGFVVDVGSEHDEVKDTISLKTDIIGKNFRSTIGEKNTDVEFEDLFETARSRAKQREEALLRAMAEDDDDDDDNDDDDNDDDDDDDNDDDDNDDDDDDLDFDKLIEEDLEDLKFNLDVDIETSCSKKGPEQIITEEQYKNIKEVENIFVDRKTLTKNAIDRMAIEKGENKLLADLWFDLTCCGFRVKEMSDISSITFKNDAEKFLLKIILMQDLPTLEQTISMAKQMKEKTPIDSQQCVKELEEIIRALTMDSSGDMFKKIMDKIDI